MDYVPPDGLPESSEIESFLDDECTLCPVCHEACGFEVSSDAQGNVTAVSDCPSCGKRTLIVSFDGDGDLRIEDEGTGEAYEPHDECYCIVSRLDGIHPEDADPDSLREYSELASMWAEDYRPAAAIRLIERVVDTYLGHEGDDGWPDASIDAFSVLFDFTLDNLRMLGTENAHALTKEYLDAAKRSGTPEGRRIQDLFYHTASDPAEISVLIKEWGKRAAGLEKRLQKLSRVEKLGLASDYMGLAMSYMKLLNNGMGLKYASKSLSIDYSVLTEQADENELYVFGLKSAAAVTYAAKTGKLRLIPDLLARNVCLCNKYRKQYPLRFARAVLLKAYSLEDLELVPTADLRREIDDAIECIEKLQQGDQRGILAQLYRDRFFSTSPASADLEDLSAAFDLSLALAAGDKDYADSLYKISTELLYFLDRVDVGRAIYVRSLLRDSGFDVPAGFSGNAFRTPETMAGARFRY